MTAPSLVQMGTNGVQAGLEQFAKAASDISKVGVKSGAKVDTQSALQDITDASVDLLQSQQQVEASAAIVTHADEVLGTIINTIA